MIGVKAQRGLPEAGKKRLAKCIDYAVDERIQSDGQYLRKGERSGDKNWKPKETDTKN